MARTPIVPRLAFRVSPSSSLATFIVNSISALLSKPRSIRYPQAAPVGGTCSAAPPPFCQHLLWMASRTCRSASTWCSICFSCRLFGRSCCQAGRLFPCCADCRGECSDSCWVRYCVLQYSATSMTFRLMQSFAVPVDSCLPTNGAREEFEIKKSITRSLCGAYDLRLQPAWCASPTRIYRPHESSLLSQARRFV
jgi:hypothetical protein